MSNDTSTIEAALRTPEPTPQRPRATIGRNKQFDPGADALAIA